MKKYSIKHIMALSEKYEKLAHSLHKDKFKKFAIANLAVAGLSILVPAIIGIIKDKSISSSELKEGIEQLKKELKDLSDLLVNPVWEGIGSSLKSILAEGLAGGAAAGTIGALIGSAFPGIGTVTVGGAAYGIGAIATIIGAILGGGAGAYQVHKLIKKFPAQKEKIDSFISQLEDLDKTYDQVLKIYDETKELNTEELAAHYQFIMELLQRYNYLLRKVQIKSGVISNDIKELKSGFTELSDTLAQYNLNIGSDIKDVEDTIAKLGPHLNKTLLEVDEVTEAIQNKEKEISENTKIETPKEKDSIESDKPASGKAEKSSSKKEKSPPKAMGDISF